MKFKNIKKAIAALLSGTLLTMAVIPYINKTNTQAFSSSMGICVDNHNVSTSGSYSRNDKYSNKMINMENVVAAYGYNSDQYKASLQHNVDQLHAIFGNDDEKILRMFWAGIVAYVTEGKSFGGNDLGGAQKWIDYAQQGYQDSVNHGYAPALPTLNFVPMTETELGMVMHGATGQSLIDRDPLLKILSNPHTLFQEGTEYDANRNYETDPLALPRLGNSWLNSYEETQAGQNGRATWPINSPGHEIAMQPGQIPDVTTVQQAALDMEKDENYVLEKDGDNTTYWIDCGETFFNNSGYLKVWNSEAGVWSHISLLNQIHQTTNIDGWDITPRADDVDGEPHWFVEFKYTRGNKPTGLTMYFELPQNGVTSVNTVGFNSAIEFVARYINVYTCDSCGGTHPGYRTIAQHQRHISFYFPDTPNDVYPCFRLGDPITNTEVTPANVTFEIFSHNEDWDTHYNVQLDKYDYETGETLEGSVFELYERFDDKDEVNRENDGAVELYEGGNEKWDS